MVGFQLSDIQRERQARARAFIESTLTPAVAAIDQQDEFPWDIVEQGVRFGLTTMLIPAAYGGGDYDNLSAGLVLEELGAACAGLATVFGASILGTGPIVLLGNEAQKQRWLSRIAADASGRFLCAFAVTEAAAGSAAASGHPQFGIQLRGQRNGDDYLLSGSKCFISNGSVARLFTVLARTHPTKASLGGLSFFVVDPAQGVRIGRVERKIGQRACPAAELLFEDTRVPADDLLGREGAGSIGLTQTISFSTPLVAAVCVGVARQATHLALMHARHSKPSLLEDQGVAMRLFDMATTVEAARNLAWRALCENDRRRDPATGRLMGAPNLKLAAMAKVFASDACVRLVDDALQIVGPEALTGNHPLSKLARDAKLMQIFEGTNQIHRIATARLL